jgi:hypothetical protein
MVHITDTTCRDAGDMIEATDIARHGKRSRPSGHGAKDQHS